MNNRGWGLQVMLAMILVLMIALVFASILINTKTPTFIEGVDATDSNQKVKSIDYKQIENKVISSLKEYSLNYHNEVLVGDSITVTIKTLKKHKILIDDSKCTGYGIIKNSDGNIIYSAYINCDGYKTSGYSESLDN